MNVKMKLFVFIIVVSAFVRVSRQNPTGHWTLLPHILVVEVDGTLGKQPLSCLESLKNRSMTDDESRDISWKKNGVQRAERGNSYLVELEESLGGGNYTCHNKDGSLLNHTVVLIQEDESARRKILMKTDQRDYLDCSAQNYNGEFHCSWTWHSSRVGKLAFIKARRLHDDKDVKCSVDVSGRHWTCISGQSQFSCSLDNTGHGISCVEEQHCPYAEEREHIQITIYVRTEKFLLESYSKYFYLSEIVKPDKVNISKVNATTIMWSYPSSWSSPFSYFPLTFQIAQLRRGCKMCDGPCTDSRGTKRLIINSSDTCQFEVKRKAKAVCVRAKDALCNSRWSEWSYLRLKRGEKNRKNRRNQNKKRV